jgi:hypothetical protein
MIKITIKVMIKIIVMKGILIEMIRMIETIRMRVGMIVMGIKIRIQGTTLFFVLTSIRLVRIECS